MNPLSKHATRANLDFVSSWKLNLIKELMSEFAG